MATIAARDARTILEIAHNMSPFICSRSAKRLNCGA